MNTNHKTIIHNDELTFRLPNTMREGMSEIAKRMDIHLSQLVRIACSNLLKQARETGRIIQQVE